MSDGVEFALSGRAVLLKNLDVSVSMQLKDKDQSGQASSTASSQQGTKAKELRVSGTIPYSESATLALLYELAEAEGEDGDRQRYRVNHETATLIKFRVAQFSGSVSASKDGRLQAWRVSFTLREYYSVAEKRAEASAAGGGAVTMQTAQGTASAEDAEASLTWFEKQLKRVNDAIGPPIGGGEA